MKQINFCLFLIAGFCACFFMHSAWSDIYDAPPPAVNPSTAMKACYTELTNCMDDCDRMYPQPYPSEPNLDFEGCVKNCNKIANLCIADVSR